MGQQPKTFPSDSRRDGIGTEEEDGPPGTSRNPVTGEPRERHPIGGPNQHDLSAEEPEIDTTYQYHGVTKGRSTPKEV